MEKLPTNDWVGIVIVFLLQSSTAVTVTPPRLLNVTFVESIAVMVHGYAGCPEVLQ